MVLISCVTNFLTGLPRDGPTSIPHRVDPVYDTVTSLINDFSTSRDSLQVLVAPPMYRKSPIWYREGLPEILSRFSSAFSSRPGNVHLLPSFSTPEFEDDGVHLTSYSGLEFVLHLFDASANLLESLSHGTDRRMTRTNESTRLLEDRVVVLEQDHRRLNNFVEYKSAVIAESEDFKENVRNEDHFVISGLTRLPSDLDTKTWQARAKSDVQNVIRSIMSRDINIDIREIDQYRPTLLLI